ncbi:MAG: MBL fold metallo-hydrolase [Anaeroplasmataceae bacterium]|nr:MBL fold metallo-hydrolase [Anaeroplasmataceae bacterium]
MKIKFLGSAAYDAIPAPFCCCEICERSRERKGHNIRSRTQALINEDLLIDFNADTISHFLKYNIDTKKIKHCLITHSHSDHLYVSDMLIPQYSKESVIVNYYAAEHGYQFILKGIEEIPVMKKYATLTCIEPYKSFTCGKYQITPFPANHDPSSSPVIFVIEEEGKRILYAHDTGVFFEEIFEKFTTLGRFDLISLDCTGALTAGYRHGHMNIETNLEMIDRLRKLKVIDDKTKIVLNHFSHNGGATYDDLVSCVPKELIVGYDGLTLEI